MEKRTKRLMSVVALALGAVGAAGAFLMRKKKPRGPGAMTPKESSVWARPGMNITFRAELMPGRDASERTFQVAELLPSGRVRLQGVAGEHAENEFERIR